MISENIAITEESEYSTDTGTVGLSKLAYAD